MLSISGLSIDGVPYTENALAGNCASVYGIKQLSTAIDRNVGKMVVINFDSAESAQAFSKRKIRFLNMTLNKGRAIGETRRGTVLVFGSKVAIAVKAWR